MAQPLSRRTLLIGGSALAFMAACGKDEGEIDVGNSPTTRGQRDVLSAVMAGSMLQTGIDERVTFAIFEGVPARLLGADAEVRVAFQKPGTNALTEPVVAQRKSEGVEERPYYVVRHSFDAPGDWGFRAVVAGKKPGDAAIKINDPATAAWPTPGETLPKVASPTAANTMGVNPICTRSEGVCPFHAQSLDRVLGNGKPTVVLLATPALCKSATCGPVLDILLAESDPHLDRMNVVHVEVFTDNTGKTLSPAFAAFKVDSEPVCFFADERGVVTERFNGPFDRTEARAAIERLLA